MRDEMFSSLASAVEKNELPAAVSGVSSVHKAVFAYVLGKETGRKFTVITPDEASAAAVRDDLLSLGANVLFLPQRDYNLAHLAGYSREYEQARINTLSKLLDGDFEMLVLSLESALLYTVPPKVLQSACFTLKAGDTVDIKALSELLVNSGYVRSELIEGPGQFSVRGDIIDVFSPSDSSPCRIDLWGDEVDTVSRFDIISQRRTDKADLIKISPAAELTFDRDFLILNLKKYLGSRRKLTEAQRNVIEKDIDALENGLFVSPDLYLPFLYEKRATVFDYIKDTAVILCESGNIKERFKSLGVTEAEDIKALLESGELSPATADLRLKQAEFSSLTEKALYFENFPRSSYETPLKGLYNFSLKRLSPWNGDMNILCEDLDPVIRTKGTAVILAGEKKAAGVILSELTSRGIAATLLGEDDTVSKSGIYVRTGGLSAGFEAVSAGFSLMTHRYLRGESTKKKKHRISGAKEIGSLDELKAGDYVVHATHGIGIFEGINRITNDRVTKDYIKIKYAGKDVLYVPVTQLDLVSKYIGAATEDGGIRLNKLGTAEWQRTRQKVRTAVKNMAKQLTALYARRMASKGYAFSPDTDLQSDFERRFEYEETEDQLRSVNEIKGDMEREIPMDRLLCGDVGFGKTEVALRAAFKCVSEGKQCALLVPTTILASQHYNTVLRRFGNMPVEVRMLSRFVSKKEQDKTVAGLKSGRVDMVIGTHRLISKDVKFKNIGLVIIDEEQRFGVAQKERLKELYPFVDILTLSATPIPRTLNMAMSGLRDMSSIDEAPGDRFPVQTYVLEQNDGVLTDAMLKELRRGGQVYYLHNRVDSIERCALKIKERIPEARVAVAHGKMGEDELNSVWEKLLEHEIDILVCTTIIETGVDVPNVNTLIIENSDRMGLSQLHQLRGRVGRSPRRAYAYFCFTRGRELSEISAKRLEAIRQFTEFGSGFKIAMRDLEIRGAGSILGGEQHGNMEAVGYDMYLKLLADAVAEENGEEKKETHECTIDLNVSAHIPESYIESLPSRLGIYKRIADIGSDEDVSDVIDELCDRFGEPPKAVTGLIDIALLRNKASAAGIYEITGTPSSVLLSTDAVNGETAAKLSEAFGKKFVISATGGKPQYVIRLQKDEKHSVIVSELSKIL